MSVARNLCHHNRLHPFRGIDPKVGTPRATPTKAAGRQGLDCLARVRNDAVTETKYVTFVFRI